MKSTVLKTPLQVVTAVEENIHIEELIYQGKTSDILGEQFAKMPHLKRITIGANSKHTRRHSADYVANIPNVEQVTLLQDAVFTEKLFEACHKKESFKCLKLHFPGKEQLEKLEELDELGYLEGFTIVQNYTGGHKEFDREEKYIESNKVLPGILGEEAELIQLDYYMRSARASGKNEELTIDDIEVRMLEAFAEGNKQEVFELMAYLRRTELTDAALEAIMHYLTCFLEFGTMLINNDYAAQLDSLLEDNIFEDLFFYMFSKATELDIINLSQEYQTYISLFPNIERLKFIAPYQNDGFPQDNFTPDLIQNPEKIHTLILQNVQVENHLDLSDFTNLTGLTLTVMPFSSLSLPSSLKEILLEDNPSFYQIPESLYANKNLEYFKFSGEVIEFTDDFYELRNMKHLFFSFFGEYEFHLSEKIANFTNLESLIVNDLPGLYSIPDEVVELKKLHTVHLYGKYESINPEIFLLPKLWNICLDSSVWTAVPNTLNDCKAMYIQVRGLNLKRVPMQQIMRLGYEFQFDSDGFKNSDFIEFYTANNFEPLPVNQYKDFFEVLLANPQRDDITQKDISLLFNVINLHDTKYVYEFFRKLEVFNPNCQSVIDIDLPEGNKEIVVLGESSMSQQMLQSQLSKIGFTIAKNVTENTTHVLITDEPHYDEGIEGRKDIYYCTEPELAALFSRYGMNQMLQEQGKAMIPQIEQMLFSPIEMNKTLALEMLKTLGVPEELHLHILALHKCTEDDAILSTTQDLIKIYCNDKEILHVLDDTREIFVPGKDGYQKYEDVFYRLNNQVDWSDMSDHSKRGYICAHLVWKISENATALAYLMNKIEHDEVGKATPYFDNIWIELQADGDKHLVYV